MRVDARRNTPSPPPPPQPYLEAVRDHVAAIREDTQRIHKNAPQLAAKLDECKDDSAAAVAEMLDKAKEIAEQEQARFAAKIKEVCKE